MKRILSLILAILCICQPICAFVAFDEAIENSQEKPRESEKKAENKNNSSLSAQNDAEGSLVELFIELFAYVWLINFSARYYPYPYSSSGTKYLAYTGFASESDEDEFAYSPTPLRRQRFSLDTSFVYLKELAIGNESDFNCMLFPCVGFYAKNLVLYDHIHNEGNMGNILLGGIIPIFQTNPLSAYLKVGWTKWYNDTHPILKDGGFDLGMELKSYPFKPLCLRWDFDYEMYENDVFVFDSDLQAGIMLDRLEVFAGWKYLSTGTEGAGSEHWNGCTCGVRLHF